MQKEWRTKEPLNLMPFCEFRTTKLSYGEIWRVVGPFGFFIVSAYKLLRCKFPQPGLYWVPCLWNDMKTEPGSLSRTVQIEVALAGAVLSPSDGSWECHYFQRPHRNTAIADSGGGIFFAPDARFCLMHIYVRAATGMVVSETFAGSFRQDGCVVSTTNCRGTFDVMPGSKTCRIRGTAKDVLTNHQSIIASMSDLLTFKSISEFADAYDRKEQMQAEWDIARGIYVPTQEV